MKTLAMVLAAVLSLLAAPPAGAQGLPAAKPEEVGLSSERLARIGAILRDDVERGRIPGVVIMVARRGKLAYVETVGFRDKAAGAPMTRDAIFRIASMTKPMVSVAAMMLYEEGRLLMADPVSKYLPALAKRQVGIEKVDPVTGKTVFYHRARRARDHGAGSPPPHLGPALRRPRHQRYPRAVPGLVEHRRPRDDGCGVHRSAGQGAAAPSARQQLGIRLLVGRAGPRGGGRLRQDARAIPGGARLAAAAHA